MLGSNDHQRVVEGEIVIIVKLLCINFKKKIDTYRGTEGSGFLWLCRTFQMIDGRTITIASHHETTISCICLIYAVDAENDKCAGNNRHAHCI